MPQPIRLGYLRVGLETLPKVFWDAMRELGWIEGQNIVVESRLAANADELPKLAAQLVESKIDLLLTGSTPATRAAKEATATIPIVFVIGADPVITGLVSNLARPGGNITGFTVGLYDEKMLELLKAALPRASRIAVPNIGVNPGRMEAAAKALGLTLQWIAAQGPDDVDRFLETARKIGAEAVFIPNAPSLYPGLERIAREATRAHLPAIAWAPTFARAGGLLSFGPTSDQMWSRTAVQIDRILKGAKAGDLPVEQQSKFQLVVNLKTAKALGITIPQAVLLRADEVIE